MKIWHLQISTNQSATTFDLFLQCHLSLLSQFTVSFIIYHSLVVSYFTLCQHSSIMSYNVGGHPCGCCILKPCSTWCNTWNNNDSFMKMIILKLIYVKYQYTYLVMIMEDYIPWRSDWSLSCICLGFMGFSLILDDNLTLEIGKVDHIRNGDSIFSLPN